MRHRLILQGVVGPFSALFSTEGVLSGADSAERDAVDETVVSRC